MSKQFYIKQFSLVKECSLILFNPQIVPLSGTTTPGQSGPGSDGNEGVICIPQISSITGASLFDCLVSFQDTRWGWSYPSAEEPVV